MIVVLAKLHWNLLKYMTKPMDSHAVSSVEKKQYSPLFLVLPYVVFIYEQISSREVHIMAVLFSVP